ncbi:MAG: Gfo/Idh/MocA family oxidoreductase [Victivallaceae bacterium]|nr:Gfo/Idh/MocA family oxidoreductase [Victivallaceae bacterium]
MKKLNVALVGCWHPHVPRYYPILQKRGDTALTCLWDSTFERGAAWSKQLHVPFVEDYDQLLKRPDVDAVCIVAETCRHAELMKKAAAAGKHIFTEKAFTLTVADAEAVREAVKRSQVNFGIAYIRATTPVFVLGKQLMEAGLLGEVNMVRIRNGVDASKMNDLPPDWFDRKTAGGGAWIDLACHQMYLMDWMLGEPKNITANAIHYYGRDVEDNVCAAVQFRNGTLGVAESTCSTFYSPYMFEIYGRKGSYICRIDAAETEIQLEAENLEKLRALLPGVNCKIEVLGGTVSNASVNSLFGARAIVKVPAAELPAQKEPIELWLDEILYNGKNPFDIECGVRLTRLMAGGQASLDTGKRIDF